MAIANDVQTKNLYQKLTIQSVGRVFYAFTVVQDAADDPACPEQLRGRLREAGEALREFLVEVAPAEAKKPVLLVDGLQGPKDVTNE